MNGNENEGPGEIIRKMANRINGAIQEFGFEINQMSFTPAGIGGLDTDHIMFSVVGEMEEMAEAAENVSSLSAEDEAMFASMTEQYQTEEKETARSEQQEAHDAIAAELAERAKRKEEDG